MIRSTLKRGLKKILGVDSAPQQSPPPAPQPPPAPASPPPSAETQAAPAEEAEAPAAEPQELEAPAEAAAAAEVQATEAPAEETQAAEAAPAAADSGDGEPIDLEEVQEILDDMVRPALQGDGGDIQLIKIESNDIYVKLVGACSSCPSSVMTMKMGVEALLREEFPSMRELIQVD